jgi:hypothetical protein
MGADIRPGTADDVIVDPKARVASTPGRLAPPPPPAEGAQPEPVLPGVMRSVDRLVRVVVGGGGQQQPPRPRPTDRARGSA